MSDRLLDTRTVAERLAMSYGRARNLLSKGEFPVPYIRIGRRIKFKESSLNKYIGSLREIQPKRLEQY